MSSEGRSARSGGREGPGGVVPQPYPAQFYPMVGYQGPPQPWFPAHSTSGAPTPWPWSPPVGYPAPTPAWSAHQTAATMTTTTTSSSPAAAPSDEYTVDTLRRIYNDDDGRVEIQRVKVQRRHPETGSLAFPTGPEAMSVVPVGSFPLNERRPPPRKNRRKQQMQVMPSAPGQPGPYPWYPYMPCVPYPYPYPYYLGGCVWPPGAPAASTTSWSGHDDSDRTSSRQDSLPATLDSQRLESRASHPSISPVPQRSPSPTAPSHLTDIHSIAPSDSVSVRGHKRESTLERALRGPTPPPRTKSRASSDFKSSDVGKTQEWILEMHRALGTTADGASDVTDKSSFTTAPSDVVVYKKIPPKRKRRKGKIDSLSDKGSLGDHKDLDNISDRQSVASDESSRLSSELTYAFRKLEKSVDAFKTEVSVDSTPVHSAAPSPSIDIIHSSGELTPTEGVTGEPPPTDISIVLDEARQKVMDIQDQHDASVVSADQTPGSVWSLPSLETAKTDSTVEGLVSRVVMDAEPSHPPPDALPHLQASSTTPTPDTGPPPSTTSVPVLQAPAETHTTPSTAAGQPQLTSVTVTSQSVAAVSGNVTSSVSPPAAPAEVTQPATKPETTASQPVPTSLSSRQVAETTAQPAPVSPPSSGPPAAAAPAETDASAGVTESEVVVGEGGRDSRASSSTFFSTRPSDEPLMVDTDSTDIHLPTTGDEGEEHTDSTTAASPGPEEGYQWVLQQPGETPDLSSANPAREDERRNAWRAEVSLWRARLVVSLCRGRGLDRQDWATFHLLVHHPLTLDLKLSLLHAPRLCAANTSTGAALVRVALIHLAQYGETLLQPEGSRSHGWRSIKVDPNQAWAPVKGAVEILRALGYREREDGGVLRYPRRSATEVSVLARLTLDMLVLAEELRLYLTGTHQYPTNISELFFTAAASSPAPADLPQRPPSSAGSFVSAHSEASLNLRPASRASSVTDDDTDTLQASVRQVKTHTKRAHRGSSSEEDVTLKDDIESKVTVKTEVSQITPDRREQPREQVVQPPTPDTAPVSTEANHLGSTVSLPTSAGDRLSVSSTMSSLPDLQSIRSSSISQKSPRHSGSATSGSNETVTPVATPAPATPTPTTPAPTTPTPKTPASDTAASGTSAPTTTDNPEEHIYEEIDVIRAQVQAQRASSVPVESAPPPLPPKKKVSSGGEDDSGLSLTYPQVEWSSASMPGSLRGGSTGARRKKRRAPMPPEFMPPDWKHYQNRPEQSTDQTPETQEATENAKKKAEYRKSLNPFYEDIESVKEKVKELNDSTNMKNGVNSDGNPFNTDGVVVAGYVGRNPFYEDVELLKDDKSSPRPSLPSPKLDGSVCPMGSLSELQDEAVVVRPKRRAPRPPPTPQPNTHPSTPEPSSHPPTPKPTKPEPPKRPPTPKILKQPSTTPPASPAKDESSPKGKDDLKQEVIISHDSNQPSTSSSQAADKSAEISDKVAPKTDEKEVVVTSNNQEVTTHPNTDEASTRVSIDTEGTKNEIKLSTTGQNEIPQRSNIQPEEDNKESPGKSTDDKVTKKESSAPPVSKDDHRGSKPEEGKEATPKLTRAAHQRAPIQHPKTPPPPPPPAKVGSVGVTNETTAEAPTEGSPPPVPPPKAPLSLLEDIPYMDANEVKYAKAKQGAAPSLQYPGKSGISVTPSLTPPTMRQSLLLLRGTSNVPFIDDSDLPPDCPPPPPPGPPPDSPPETPHTSPPETPDTSPPDTPRASPQPQIVAHTPLVSPASTETKTSPDTRKIERTEEDADDVAPPIPPKTLSLTTSAPAETSQLISTVAPSNTQSPTTTEPQPSTSPESSQLPPPLPSKTTLQAVTPAPSETSASDTHEPASGKHSLQSSMSEERYEIPDTSRAPPPRPPPPTQTPAVTQAEDKTSEPYTAPSEADRYEVPEAPKEEAEVPKKVEVEERYEIPEVVKESTLKGGSNGGPVTMVMGRTNSTKQRNIEAVFGPPKPPRRRRSHPAAPPRPPKNVGLMDGTRPLSKTGTGVRPPSATSSFSTTSGATSSSHTTPPKLAECKEKSSKSRRSWPFLFCDCVYVNCRTYDEANKK